VDVITVHGASLEGNLTGDSADRRVSVYLPPSYATAKSRRYPVVYLLHGFTDSDDAGSAASSTSSTCRPPPIRRSAPARTNSSS
jgi:predicted alpha/beta superfamily hydrolase